METTFDNAMTALEAMLSQETPDYEELVQGLRGLHKAWPSDPTSAEVHRIFAACHAMLALEDGATETRRLSYSAMEQMKRMMIDEGGQHRRHIQHSFDHHTAFGREMPYSRFDGPIPLAHMPLSVAEARALVQPLFYRYEAEIEADPMAHLRLAWKVLEHPVAPFDQVFDAWLREVEAKGLGYGDSHSGLRRAMALCGLAERGQQRVSREDVDQIFLPILDDRNPMLAAAAARFMGRVHAEDAELCNRGTPWELPALLDHIAERAVEVRPAVPEGFCTDLEGMTSRSPSCGAMPGCPSLIWRAG